MRTPNLVRLPLWRGRWLLLALAVVLAAAVATPILAQELTFTRWTLPDNANSIGLDPSGPVWTTTSYNRMHKLDPAANEVTTYSHDYVFGTSYGVAVDGQGNVWFSDYTVGGHYWISRLNPDPPNQGEVTAWPLGTGSANAVGYAVVPDSQGNVWFISGKCIAELDPATDTITRWCLASAPKDILLDSQGRVWFTRPDVMKVGVLDPVANDLTQWDIPGTNMSAQPGSIFLDDQGRLWFGVWGVSLDALTVNEIVRLDEATDEMTEYVCPVGACAGPTGIVVNAQGKVWFGENSGGGHIQKLDPAGALPVFTRWDGPGYYPQRLLPAAGGAMWIQYSGRNYVDRFLLP